MTDINATVRRELAHRGWTPHRSIAMKNGRTIWAPLHEGESSMSLYREGTKIRYAEYTINFAGVPARVVIAACMAATLSEGDSPEDQPNATRGDGMGPVTPSESALLTIAYQHPRYKTGGESKRDHAVTVEEEAKGSVGRTLCGRKLGGWYFQRHDRWYGDGRTYECRTCSRSSRPTTTPSEDK